MKIYTLIILLLLSLSLNAQELQYEVYGEEDGFVNDHIVELYVDSQNRMWVCTEWHGLYIYQDGVFTHIDEDEYGLLTGRPMSFDEDEEGNVWIGFYHSSLGGVMKYDGTTFTAEHTPSDEVSIARVADIIVEEDALYIYERSNDFNLNTLNIVQTDTILSYDFGQMNTADFLSEIGEMEIGFDGEIWMTADYQGTYIFEEGAVNLLLGPSVDLGFSRKLEKDTAGYIWDVHSKAIRCYKEDLTYSTDLYYLNNFENHFGVIPGYSVRDIFTDSFGRIWFTTYGADELANNDFNYRMNYFEDGRFYSFNLDYSSIDSNDGTLVEDHEHNFWLGMDTVLVKITTNMHPDSLALAADTIVSTTITTNLVSDSISTEDKYEITHYDSTNGLSDAQFTALFTDSQGRVWAGTYDGHLYSVDSDTVTEYLYYDNHFYDYNPIEGRITDFDEDEEGNIYISIHGDEIYGGVYVYDDERIKRTHVKAKDRLITPKVRAIEYHNNVLWVATSDDISTSIYGGLHIIKEDTTLIYAVEQGGEYEDFNGINDIVNVPNSDNEVAICGNSIAYLEVDSLGNMEEYEMSTSIPIDWNYFSGIEYGGEKDIWVGNYQGYISYEEDMDWESTSLGWASKDLERDSDNQMWILLEKNNQLKVMCLEEEWEFVYQENEGDNIFKRTIVEDQEKNIWFTKMNGLAKVKKVEDTSTNNLKPPSQLKCYPNPANTQLYIQTPNYPINYQLFNDLGQIVEQGQLSQSIQKLDVSKLRNGIYHLKVGAMSTKVIVLR